MLNAVSCFFGRMGSGKKDDPMAFLDEYAAVGLRLVLLTLREAGACACGE